MSTTSEVQGLANGLEQQAAVFRLLAQFSYDGLWVTDGHCRTMWINAASERFYGVRLEDVMGRHARDLERQGVFRPSAVLLALKERRRVTLTHSNAQGRVALVTATPVLEGNCARLVVVNVRDVADIVQSCSGLIDAGGRTGLGRPDPGRLRRARPWSEVLVADDPAMQRVMTLAEKVAACDVPILITGETGAGKNLLARQIHQMSSRAGGPFIEADVSTIPESLLESELFGYEPWAFTGAHPRGKPGLFELASGGTLVLDEISEMPLNLQVKLLRAVQEGKVRRVGGVTERTVDFRLIAISNRDLSGLVDAGRFRKDLYYRLNVVPINIPPLRERRASIPPLVFRIMNRLSRKYGVDRGMSADALHRLVNYSWPGNVRQLEHVLERLVLTVDEDLITPDHLPEELQGGADDAFPGLREVRPFREVVAEFERAVINHAVATCGSTRAAARALGIGLATLVRKRRPLPRPHL